MNAPGILSRSRRLRAAHAGSQETMPDRSRSYEILVDQTEIYHRVHTSLRTTGATSPLLETKGRVEMRSPLAHSEQRSITAAKPLDGAHRALRYMFATRHQSLRVLTSSVSPPQTDVNCM